MQRFRFLILRFGKWVACASVVCVVSIFLGTTLFASPDTRFVQTLQNGDRLVVKSAGCQLQITQQDTFKITVKCIAATLSSHPQPETKFKRVLAAGDKLIIRGNFCALQIASNSATRIVLDCIAAPATVTPTPTATTSAAPDWLKHVNGYRTLANLPGLSENTTWSNGDWLHARYMVKNDFIGHSEDTNNAWYSAEGNTAAQNSNVAVSSSTALSDRDAIDLWIQGPFHAVGILDPALGVTGYGSYREADGGYQTGAALDVLRGLGEIPASVTFPLMFPGNLKTVGLASYNGGESPNPLSGCSNYAVPTGLPIILQIGSGSLTPNVTAHSFKQGSTELEHCIFDETNYANANSSQQSLGRNVLGARDAIVLIPRAPLEAGKSYTVSITTNGNTHTWSFTIASHTVNPHGGNAEIR